MNEFVLLFRRSKNFNPRPNKCNSHKAMAGPGSIAAQDKLAGGGSSLSSECRVVKPNNVGCEDTLSPNLLPPSIDYFVHVYRGLGLLPFVEEHDIGTFGFR